MAGKQVAVCHLAGYCCCASWAEAVRVDVAALLVVGPHALVGAYTLASVVVAAMRVGQKQLGKVCRP